MVVTYQISTGKMTQKKNTITISKTVINDGESPLLHHRVAFTNFIHQLKNKEKNMLDNHLNLN